MHSFESDYTAGARVEILRRLNETNLEQLPGYGSDKYCESAKEKIRAACDCPGADIFFMVGGTQTNAVVIDSMLPSYGGVIAAQTGHISDHEAGAIEFHGPQGHRPARLRRQAPRRRCLDVYEGLLAGCESPAFCLSRHGLHLLPDGVRHALHQA